MSDFEGKTSFAAKLINEADYIVALTGAGISTPSGIPDFRTQKTGLWEKNDPLLVASLSTFLNQPKVFFDWLKPLVKDIYFANPNAAHESLARLEKENKLKAIVTQNIDNLHQKAGAKNVIEVHGSISELVCLNCKIKVAFDEHLVNNFIDHFLIPKCEHCQKFLKPSITLFEEMLPVDAWDSAFDHFQKADLVIVIGSSLEVYPANQLPAISVSNGAKLIINTFSTTPMDKDADLLLPFDVIEVWPKILQKLNIK
ncbi:MAG: NAD-dependent deacylase [Anaerolineaceae bacterium]|nr:NAD-dependent deacylase [Anaerolineaceae bacterium]